MEAIRFAVVAAALLAAGCAMPKRLDTAAQPAAPAQLASLPQAERNRILSEGYAQFYDAVSGLAKLDRLLLVKIESDATDALITKLAQNAAAIKGELEQMARAYPSLSLKDDGLPFIEKQKDKLQLEDHKRSLAPLKGAKGADFERTLLMLQSGALHQVHFLAQAIADAEKSPERRAAVLRAQRQLDGSYNEIVAQLDQRFFKPPANTPRGAPGGAAGAGSR